MLTPPLQPRVRPMAAADLAQVLAWRNHPDICRYMYTQHEITLEEHTRWFERASQDSTRHLLIFECDAVPLGFISFHQVAQGGIADWGFYIAPDAQKGTGMLLGRTALQFAFEQAGLHKVCGQALIYNERSIGFHQKLGFTREGALRDQHFDGQTYYDVVCFGLLASEWRSQLK